MALIQINYLSKALFRTVPVNVILPVDRISFQTGGYEENNAPFKTLYLLHGLLGNYTDWVTGTRIQRFAEEKNLAVVMPSGDNAFYVNTTLPNNDYGTFIGEELVNITRRMFPLSHKKEDTFIAGLSMGGFGAIRNGLKYPDTFGYIAGLSSAVHLFDENVKNVAGESGIFGNMNEARKSDKNPAFLLEGLCREGREIPRVYLACGLQDSLLEANRRYRDLFLKAGADLTYVEENGGHEWDFWDRQIKAVLDWLPLDSCKGTLGSGNVTDNSKKK